MSKVLIIDDYNEITFASNENIEIQNSQIYNFEIAIKGIGAICINRNLKYIGIIQLVRLLNTVTDIKKVPIIILTDRIRNFETKELKLYRNCKFKIITDFSDNDIFRLLDNNEEKNNAEFFLKPNISNLLYSHNPRGNNMTSHILKSAINIDTVAKSVSPFIEALNTVVTNDIVLLILDEGKSSNSYSIINNSVKKTAFEDFNKFCLHNHYDNFRTVNVEAIDNIFLTSINEDNYNSLDILNKRISSYFYSPVYNYNGDIIGTIHMGNFINNFFNNSELRESLNEIIYRSGMHLGNAIDLKKSAEKKSSTFSVFSKFIPPRVIERLLKDGQISRTGEVRRICVLFSDIRSFTAISEKNTAEDVVKLLNNYFNIMINCIREQGGVIDKLIGDAIMAMFGAPDSMDDIEIKSLNAARNMIASLEKVDTTGLILPPMGFKIGIGLHVGNSIVGNVGSSQKKAYTSIGNISTIAEELESLTKEYKEQIIITSDVAEKSGGTFLDKILVDGREIQIYSVEEG